MLRTGLCHRFFHLICLMPPRRKFAQDLRGILQLAVARHHMACGVDQLFNLADVRIDAGDSDARRLNAIARLSGAPDHVRG